MIIDDAKILVDFERGRTVEGWVPRRFGGGLGGKKESGQIRFGGRDRPFKRNRYNNQTSPIPSKRDALDGLSKSGVIMNVEDSTSGKKKTLLLKEHKSKVIIKDIS